MNIEKFSPQKSEAINFKYQLWIFKDIYQSTDISFVFLKIIYKFLFF